eukprot:4204922-Amphidinium_carterae.1
MNSLKTKFQGRKLVLFTCYLYLFILFLREGLSEKVFGLIGRAPCASTFTLHPSKSRLRQVTSGCKASIVQALSLPTRMVAVVLADATVFLLGCL